MYMTGDGDETAAYVEWLRFRTINFLSRPQIWAAVEALAGELVIRRTITARTARRIIQSAILAYIDERVASHPIFGDGQRS
jgi:hypothetical protein